MHITYAEINLGVLENNLSLIRKHVGRLPVMAVVKANGYGHGLVPVARLYEKLGIDWLAVAIQQEGIHLRKAGISCPILVFGGLLKEQIPDFFKWDLDLTVSSLENLEWTKEAADSHSTQANIHLKLDTGMSRIGARNEDAEALIRSAIGSPQCHIRGVYSHLACADEPESPMTMVQLKRFLERTEVFRDCAHPLPMRHLANSGGVLHFPGTHLDLVRPGILLYGVYPDPRSRKLLDVKPALSLKSRVVFRKPVHPGESISYGATWSPRHTIEVATIPVGYGDGYRRDLSNLGSVLIQNRKYPIVGRVCMDQLMVNLERNTVNTGEPVVLIGEQGHAKITAEEMAEQIKTIPYEILTGLNERIPRVYIQ